MKTVILHFGVHRTGSTHLQYNLQLNKKILSSYDVGYFRFHENPTLRSKICFLRKNIHEIENQDFLKELKKSIQSCFGQYEKLIISYEGLLGELNLATHNGIYPNSRKLIKVYKKIFSDYVVKPVIVVRDYYDFIISTFKYEILHGTDIDFNEYVSQIKLIKNKWSDVISDLHGEFGGCSVYTFEEYKKNPKKVLLDIIKMTDHQINEKQVVTDMSKKNISPSNYQLDKYRNINRFLHNCLPESYAKRIAEKINLTLKNKKQLSRKYLEEFDYKKILINHFGNKIDYESEMMQWT